MLCFHKGLSYLVIIINHHELLSLIEGFSAHFHLILIKAVEPCGCLCFKVLINCLYILDDIISDIVIVFKSDINYIGLLLRIRLKTDIVAGGKVSLVPKS